jgi:prepilin signal peptidase PulO-like enzyme (type II secretory pathway)
MKIFGKIPNRWFFAVLNSILAVVVELFLYAAGALVWSYTWWGAGAPWLIFLIGYLPFNVVAFWVYDAKTMKKRFAILGTILAVDFACIALFVPLGWI